MSASPSSEAPRPSPAHLTGEWARLLFATLSAAGVEDLWVSPGSRSTPFTWAAQHTPGLRLRSIIDERSAAFLALGHARVTGRPSALLCTSGTAAANYFPAIVEASLSYLPLIVLTADRPLDLQQAGAAQTIDQVKLYGDHVRTFFDLGPPDAELSSLRGLQRAVAQAVAQTQGPLPGPVHLNLRARKPLEPAPAASHAERQLSARVTELLQRPLVRHAPTSQLANEAVLAAARTLSDAASGAIVVGPLKSMGSQNVLGPLSELSRLLRFPILAEAASQVRFALSEHELTCPWFDWLLSVPGATERHRPEVLLCLGQTPTSSAFDGWATSVPRRLVFAEQGWPDAVGGAELVASGDLPGSLDALVVELKRLGRARSESAFAVELLAAHALCEARVNEALTSQAPELTEGVAVKCVLESLPDDSVLALGNSLPIRDADAYVRQARRLRVMAQRGANGIDGLISGAIGSAIGSGAPTLLLLGDVSFLHDLGALSATRLLTTPLAIAIIDNAGGRIFDQLPVRKLYADEPETARLWLTPPDCDFSHAAALFGLAYAAPATAAAVRSATAEALARNGVTLLHLRVGRDSASAMRRGVLEGLARDLERAQG